VYAGINARINAGRFFAAQSLKFGLPGKTGSMEDRDRMAYWTDTNKTTLTNYSISEIEMTSALFSETRIGWRQPIKGAAAGEVFAAFDLKYILFEANYTQGLYYAADESGNPAGYIRKLTEKIHRLRADMAHPLSGLSGVRRFERLFQRERLCQTQSFYHRLRQRPAPSEAAWDAGLTFSLRF